MSGRIPPGSPADAGAWLAAQAGCAADLAGAALAMGRLDQCLAQMPAGTRRGALHRLALLEAEAMLWAQGTPLSRDEIGLDLMAARAGTDLAAMAQARWAVRRLEGQGDPAALRGFLGLHRGEGPGVAEALAGRPAGADFDAAAEGFAKALAGLSGLHPLARAPAAAVLWRLAGLSPDHAPIESAVWQARMMALPCRALAFLPLGRAGHLGAGGSGDVAGRLARHLAGAARGADEALRHLTAVAAWAGRARMATARIKGDSPARIVAALAARPLMSAAMIEEECGLSRDTAERLLARMARMGLLREATGGRRFRLFAAALQEA